MPKKFTITTLLILASLTLVVSGCIKKPVIQPTNQNQPVNINQNANTTTSTADEAVVIPEELKETTIGLLKMKYPEWLGNFEIEKAILFWRREDGSRMALYGAYTLQESVKNKTLEEIKKEIESLTSSPMELPQQDDLKKFFKQQGFLPNGENTGEDFIYGDVRDYRLAFEKGDEKCVAYWNNEVSLPSSTYIGCAIYTKNDEVLYKEFSSLFKDPNSYWSITKFQDGFATGNYSSSRSGNEWYAKKVSNKWIIFLETQEDPLCSNLEKNGVPVTFYAENCWLDGGNLEVSYEQYKS